MKDIRPDKEGATYLIPDASSFEKARDYFLDNNIIPW